MQNGQFFAVVRHAERADVLGASVDGAEWTLSDDFTKWPQDPPLSDAGIDAAQDIAKRLHNHLLDDRDLTEQANPVVIITSPYQRCYQTAAEVSLRFGCSSISVDPDLAEIFGPSIMGPVEPETPTRPDLEILEICMKRGVCCSFPYRGSTMPEWPEERRSAQRRFARCFMKHVDDAIATGTSVILVSHSTCVSSVLSLIPSHRMYEVEKVDYGGFFVAQQVAHDGLHGHREGLAGIVSAPGGLRLRCVLTQHVAFQQSAVGSSPTRFLQRVSRLLADDSPREDASGRRSFSKSADGHGESVGSHDSTRVGSLCSRSTVEASPPSPRHCDAEPVSRISAHYSFDSSVVLKDAGCQLSHHMTESDSARGTMKGGRRSMPALPSVTLRSDPAASSLLLRRSRRSV